MDEKKLAAYLQIVIIAHQQKTNQFGKPTRALMGGEQNPYFSHPLWCFSMLLAEPKLPESIRIPGALALLFHDVLEDTTEPLPNDLPENIKQLINQLTVEKEAKYHYSSWEKEKLTILHKPIHIQLLKLYDKTASLYDRAIAPQRYPEWIAITSKLANNIEKTYGKLNIVMLTHAVIAQLREELGNK